MILTARHAKLLVNFLYWSFANILFSIDNIPNPIDLKYDFINFNFETNSIYKNNYKKVLWVKFKEWYMYLKRNEVFVLYNQEFIYYIFEYHYNYWHCWLFLILFHYLLTLFDEFFIRLWDSHLNFLFYIYISSNKFIKRSHLRIN